MTLPLPLIEATSAMTAAAAGSAAAAAVLFDFASALVATVPTGGMIAEQHARSMASVSWVHSTKASEHQHADSTQCQPNPGYYITHNIDPTP
jgi:hypothetical protein